VSTIYDVLHRPIVTEKSNYQNSQLHQYTFEVAGDASKTLVKDAIETLFDVDVLRVNVINVPAGALAVGRAVGYLSAAAPIKKPSSPLQRATRLKHLKG